jgi:hypothetical protein
MDQPKTASKSRNLLRHGKYTVFPFQNTKFSGKLRTKTTLCLITSGREGVQMDSTQAIPLATLPGKTNQDSRRIQGESDVNELDHSKEAMELSIQQI